MSAPIYCTPFVLYMCFFYFILEQLIAQQVERTKTLKNFLPVIISSASLHAYYRSINSKYLVQLLDVPADLIVYDADHVKYCSAL